MASLRRLKEKFHVGRDFDLVTAVPLASGAQCLAPGSSSNQYVMSEGA